MRLTCGLPKSIIRFLFSELIGFKVALATTATATAAAAAATAATTTTTTRTISTITTTTTNERVIHPRKTEY
jgi:hypothetical protein